MRLLSVALRRSNTNLEACQCALQEQLERQALERDQFELQTQTLHDEIARHAAAAASAQHNPPAAAVEEAAAAHAIEAKKEIGDLQQQITDLKTIVLEHQLKALSSRDELAAAAEQKLQLSSHCESLEGELTLVRRCVFWSLVVALTDACIC